MRLFHFTFVAPLFAMLGAELLDGPAKGERGIVPSTGGPEHLNSSDNGLMTGGKPVVWLTSRASLRLTAEDLAWVQTKVACGMGEDLAEEMRRGPLGDRTVRIEVDLGNSKRLRHYATWVRESGMIDPRIVEAIMRRLPPSALTDWWVYFGTIQRKRIVNLQRTDAP